MPASLRVGMKVIVGVDLQHAYVPALHLLGKLQLTDPELLLVQASPTVESMLPPFPMDGATVDFMYKTFKEAGEAALLDAEAEARKLGLHTLPLLCIGPSAELINECVEREGAELVVVRTTHRGTWQSEFLGSVSRAVMLCGHVSVLAAKQEPIEKQRLDVVFATDGSEFNERCLDRLLAMRPSGIETVHVVCAWGISSHLEHLLRHALPHSADLNAELEAAAKAAAERAASRLSKAGYKTTARATQGPPDRVLHEVMAETGSDLLVVGAHGKGWVERLLIGSTSLHELVDETY